MEYESSKIYTPVSLFSPICPASCLLPFILQSAILNYLSCLQLSMLTLRVECRSSLSHSSAPFCLANICSYFKAQLNLLILCKVTFSGLLLSLQKNWLLSFWGAPSPYNPVNISLTLLDCKLLSRAHRYFSVQLINRKISSEWRMGQLKIKANLGAKAKWILW